MPIFTFTVDGEPTPKGRPRFAMGGRYPRAYTPKNTKDAEKNIRDFYLYGEYVGIRPAEVIRKSLTVDLEFYFEPKTRLNEPAEKALKLGRLPHKIRPDIDNLVKLVLDALNGVAWHDDCQISSLTAIKKYAEKSKTKITISW